MSDDPEDPTGPPWPPPQPPSGQRPPPDPDEAFERLRERWERGSDSLRREEVGPDWWSELAEQLGPEQAEFLGAFEAHVNEQADRWGRDRFQLGYALGASGLLEILERE